MPLFRILQYSVRRSLIEFCFIHGAIHGRRMVDTVILIVQNPSQNIASSHNRVTKNIFLYKEIFYWRRSKCHIVERVTLFQIFIVEMWSWLRQSWIGGWKSPWINENICDPPSCLIHRILLGLLWHVIKKPGLWMKSTKFPWMSKKNGSIRDRLRGW